MDQRFENVGFEALNAWMCNSALGLKRVFIPGLDVKFKTLPTRRDTVVQSCWRL